MTSFEKKVIAVLIDITNELKEIKTEIRKQRVNSEFCTKDEALEILGWATTPKAGKDKLAILRKQNLLSRPSHAPYMYITDEVKKLKEQFGGKVVITRTKEGYKVKGG